MNVPTGYTALDLIGFTDRGVYSASATYVKNDLAEYNGAKWRCLVDDTTGTTPVEGASWTLFANFADDMTGATTSADGVHGLVPAPTSADRGKFLMGSGGWGSNISTTTTDPGEGSALATNHILIVIEE